MGWRLSRYLISRVLVGIGLVSLLLVGLYTLVELLREARSLAGDYQGLQMVAYLVETLPRRLYDVFPFAALIGVMVGLGGLASGNELVAMRASGFDRQRIIQRVLLAVILCLLLLAAMAEWLIPDLESKARAEREQARSGQIQHGRQGALWLRDRDHMIRVGLSLWVDEQALVFGEIQIYRIDEASRPSRIYWAERGHHDGSAWQLEAVHRLQPDRNGPSDVLDRLEIESDLRPELFAATVSRPRLLSLGDLVRMGRLLERNGLDAGRYREAFWERLYFPLNVLAMVLIGLPFVFAGMRQRNPGFNLFIGVAVGLLFFVLTRLAQGMSGIVPLPLWLTLLMPPLSIAGLAVLLLRRR
ncbi:LPS export ABC transporter permease LptG [Wenzhouxiangella marina]|uniref:LPS export ABC transporter permease LptG n=1 Tax=Wenzhouxiangella marina TaxID=1579979 RepID=A0A0K0XTA6_9GAMM|nr:LPS export ABC transporter permease LptG [Wenzhouxiangella marina]AKS40851.1 hypothetical protein WM2015_469 [Wenzhouxiangella marina]